MLCLSVIQSRSFFRHLVSPTTRCLFFYSAESGFLMWSIYNAQRGEPPSSTCVQLLVITAERFFDMAGRLFFC